jgi:DNA ligase-associated metallophosphoesterase
MQAPLLHTLQGQKLWLSGHRALFWEEEKTLVVSDLHFGKTGHFRKAGIAVPQGVYREDLQRLVSLLQSFRPEHLLVVGDFFHSSANEELDWFRRWRLDFSSLALTLVRGNHDILQQQWYRDTQIDVVEGTHEIGVFRFAHEPGEEKEGRYTFSGHLHPGISLQGVGKQSLRLPCFFFGASQCILPAFSKFTGLALIRPSRHDKVFALADDKVIAIG